LRGELSLLVQTAGLHSTAAHLAGKPLGQRSQAAGRAIADIGAHLCAIDHDAQQGPGTAPRYVLVAEVETGPTSRSWGVLAGVGEAEAEETEP
jgi:hypothetical protein